MRECSSCHGPIPETKPRAQWCSERCKVHKRDRRMQCLHCLESFISWGGAKFCTPRCYERFNAEKRVLARDMVCVDCGVDFTLPMVTGKRLLRCSPCQEVEVRRRLSDWAREKSLRRRAAVVEKFRSIEIFERDEWTCGICSLPVDRHLRRPDPMSVSLDHVIPIARGGEHTRANTQCSHLLCNVRKGARMGEVEDAMRTQMEP